MAAKKKGLGRGLDALMSSPQTTESTTTTRTVLPEPARASAPGTEVALSSIRVNPYQPRKRFDEQALEELTESIKEMGVLTPLLVRTSPGKGTEYELVAGERRFRASQNAGLITVPVIVRDLTDQESLEIALVENLQRRDLNVVEEAEGYQQLAEEFGLTQEAIAKRVGKGRATVANALRLLTLSPVVRDMLAEGGLSAGHAKALLAIEIESEQELVAREAVVGGWSVRETERQVKKRMTPGTSRSKGSSAKDDIPLDHVTYLTDHLHKKLGTKVHLKPSQTLANGKTRPGKLEIQIFSNDDLDRVLDLLGLSEDL